MGQRFRLFRSLFIVGLLSTLPTPILAQEGTVVRDRCAAIQLACSIGMQGHVCNCLTARKNAPAKCNLQLSSEELQRWERSCREQDAPPTLRDSQCHKFQDYARRKAEEMRKAREKWNGTEKDYLSFYDASKVSMEAVFDKIYYELPGEVRFSGSFNILVKVEKNSRLRHHPRIKLKMKPGSQSQIEDYLTLLSDLSAVATAGASAMLADAATVKSWLGYWADANSSTTMSFEKGVVEYRKMMRDRQRILDNYRVLINVLYCNDLVPKERELFNIRTKTLPKQRCAANVHNAIDGWLARPTTLRNEQSLERVETFCRKKKHLKSGKEKKKSSKKKKG